MYYQTTNQNGSIRSVCGTDEELPGCCGVVVAHSACGAMELLGIALSDSNVLASIEDAHTRGLILYTLTKQQTLEAAQLKKAGFRVLTTFFNPNSGNTVTLYGKKINQPTKRKARTTKRH